MKLFKLIIALAFVPFFSANAQTIKLNLVKGAKFEVATVSKISSVASVMGQEMETTIDNSIVENIQVKDKRTSESDLESTITKLTLNMQGMGQETVYDSDKKDNTGLLTETLDKLKGNTKSVTVDANGKVLKQDKVDSEIAAASSMAGISADVLPFLKSSFAGKEAKPGTTWDDSTTIAAEKMRSTTKGNYTIQSVNAGTITIAFAGTENSSGTMEQMGMEMATSSTSKVTAQIEVDMATGLIKKSTQTTEGNMNVEANGMSIPVATKSTITITAKQL